MKKFAAVMFILGLSGVAFADGDVNAGQTKSAACGACHGADGNQTLAPNFPKLAGQGARYTAKQLQDFKSGARIDPVMNAQSMSLSDQDMADIAAYYATLDIQNSAVAKEFIEMGQALYRGGDKENKISACSACHGPTGQGLELGGFASLAGQNPQYTIKQLKAFRSGERNTDSNRMMRDVAAKLSDAQIEALAHYLAGLH